MSLSDESARQAALAIDASVIVQAPAGSGKTELLCQRFLAALAQVEQPEQVLAITFTRKAAAEMRERILRYLHNPQKPLAQAALQQDQKNHWQLLQHPERLSIMTIDSLCARIVEQSPLQSNIYGYKTTDTAFELYRAAATALLEDADQPHPWQKDLHELLLCFGNNWQKLHDLLVNMLAKREQWLILLPEINDASTWRINLEKNLAACAQAAINAVDKRLSPEIKTELLALLQFAAETVATFACWGEQSAWPQADLTAEELWRSLPQLLLTQDGSLRKTVDKRSGFPTGEGNDKDFYKAQKQRMLALLNTLSEIEGLQQALANLVAAPATQYSEEQWQRVIVVLNVLRALLAYWQVTIQQRKEVDFTEVALRALMVLGQEDEPTELALALDYRLQHILVDEFQDTSLLQYRLLERLTQSWQPGDGHSLFLVGDPLQSIYRFRQAEVGLFLRAWQQGFANLTLQPIQLTQNFRAQKKLVDFYNQQLAQVLPRTSVIHEGAVSYTSVVASHSELPDKAVHFTTVENIDEADNISYVTELVRRIQTLQQQQPSAKVAILVRSRSHLNEIIPALHAANIDYLARDLTGLAEQPVIIDLLTWLRALLNLDDRLAWLAMLHAPWLGISLTTLQQLFEKDERIIWQRLETWQHNVLEQTLVDSQENTQLQKIIALWHQALSQRQRQPLDQILAELWIKLGAEDYYGDPISQKAVQQFWLLLQSYQQAGDLVEYEQFARHLAQQALALEEKQQGLEIMTIHKAKGLEFDFVFLPALERPGQHDDLPLLVFDEIVLPDGPRFILAPLRQRAKEPDKIFDYVWQIQKVKNHHERLRLLYVACTRAKQALFCYATLPEKIAEYKPRHGSFLADFWPIWG